MFELDDELGHVPVYVAEDELDHVPLVEMKRQIEVGDKLLTEYRKMYKKINKLHNDIFMYAPEVLDWGTGSSMSVIQGAFEDEIDYLDKWLKGMVDTLKHRSD